MHNGQQVADALSRCTWYVPGTINKSSAFIMQQLVGLRILCGFEWKHVHLLLHHACRASLQASGRQGLFGKQSHKSLMLSAPEWGVESVLMSVRTTDIPLSDQSATQYLTLLHSQSNVVHMEALVNCKHGACSLDTQPW